MTPTSSSRRVAARLGDGPRGQEVRPGIPSSVWSRDTSLCSWDDHTRRGTHNQRNKTLPDQHPWYEMPNTGGTTPVADAIDFELFGDMNVYGLAECAAVAERN